MLVLGNENDFLYLYYAVSSLVCDSKINLFFYLHGFNCESEYVFAFSLQAVTAVWIFYHGMEPSHQVIFVLLLVLLWRNGKALRQLTLRGHGSLVQNNLG
jgi:hypothetical protein